MFRTRNAAVLGCAIVLSAWNAAQAQVKLPPGGKELKETGAVQEGTQAGTLVLKNGTGTVWRVIVDPRDATVHVEGTAEPEFLHPGVSVRLTAEIDKKGALKEELRDLEIYSPVKQDAGIYASDADEKPVKSIGEGGKFYIKGRIKTFRAPAISIQAGTKVVTGKLTPEPAIKVNATDLSFAQPDDEATVTGWYNPNNGPGPNKAGVATGTEVSVKLAKPLAGAKKKTDKKPEKVAKTAKSKPVKAVPGGAKGPVVDPFAPAAGDSKEEKK